MRTHGHADILRFHVKLETVIAPVATNTAGFHAAERRRHGFIRAEVTAFDDYIEYKGEQGAKDAGKWRSEGKDYIVKDGDVILYRFNV